MALNLKGQKKSRFKLEKAQREVMFNEILRADNHKPNIKNRAKQARAIENRASSVLDEAFIENGQDYKAEMADILTLHDAIEKDWEQESKDRAWTVNKISGEFMYKKGGTEFSVDMVSVSNALEKVSAVEVLMHIRDDNMLIESRNRPMVTNMDEQHTLTSVYDVDTSVASAWTSNMLPVAKNKNNNRANSLAQDMVDAKKKEIQEQDKNIEIQTRERS